MGFDSGRQLQIGDKKMKKMLLELKSKEEKGARYLRKLKENLVLNETIMEEVS